MAISLRTIVEMTDFQHLRPVRPDGSEYDDLVLKGPTEHWQVIANDGVSYIVYFWGDGDMSATEISLPPGTFRYSWMDTREKKSPLKTGTVTVRRSGRARIEPPDADNWDIRAGIVLVLNAY